MSLADHYDGGFLSLGNHEVEIAEIRTFAFNSGNPGVEFHVQDADGRKGKISFVLVDSALWKLANFARDAGLTKDQARQYDPIARPKDHRVMMGRQVGVIVEKPGEYREIVDHYPLNQGPPASRPGQATPCTVPHRRPDRGPR